MPFIEIDGTNVRNLSRYKISPAPTINIISGKNGAGKTNLLEAVYLNGLGKSFRTNKTRNIIREGEPSCVVFAKFEPEQSDAGIGPDIEAPKGPSNKIGVERRRSGSQLIRVDGKDLSSMAELAKLVPMVAIQPTEMELIDGAASQRRKYLDWLVFHVEHQFIDLWRDFQRLIKQRNSLLRKAQKGGRSADQALQLQAWDHEFINACLAINSIREQYCQRVCELTNEYIKIFQDASNEELAATDEQLKPLALKFDFYCGWNSDISLEKVLIDGYEQDLRRGFTRSGSHRADIVITANGYPAKEYLSRGQKKLVSMIMRLAQVKYLMEAKQVKSVILVDDLSSELDSRNVATFCQLLESLETQVFLTALDNDKQLINNFKGKIKEFHVEHGNIN